MKLLCTLFGHQPPIYAKKGWYSPGQEYGKVVKGCTDGIGQEHGHVEAACARCGDNFIIARIHIPESREEQERIHREKHSNTLYPHDWSHLSEKNFATLQTNLNNHQK